MSEDLLSPFHSSLLQYIKNDVEKRIETDGPSDELSKYRKKIDQALLLSSSDAAASLSEVIEHYQHLFEETKPVQIDQKLIEAISSKEFGLKVYRGLPRVYRKDNPAESHVKKEFSHLPTLKRICLERFLLPLYEKQSIPSGARVTLFTWVISDGWGDLIAGKEILAILKERFPNLKFFWIALVPKKFSGANFDASFTYYEGDCKPEILSEESLNILRDSDLILSAPTFYPYTSELMQRLKVGAKNSSPPELINIGQYGYIESSWFHPKSNNRSMGLHFLEKGILIRKPMNADFSRIENKELLQILFETTTPGPIEIEKYLESHQFYLAYLLSPIGGAVYLHALFQSLRHSDLPIDICTPDLGWFIKYVEGRKTEEKPLIEGIFGIESIEVIFGGKSHLAKVAENGKKVRLICPGPISDADFRLLVRLSGEFVGVRGDQSFSEVISANRAFFYDGAPHARYFMKDLLALAENKLAVHRNTLSIFRGMSKTYLHNLTTDEEGEWVDETYFQERRPWKEIAIGIGNALLDPDALAGFKKFNRILAEEHSCNQTLCHLVQRGLAHRFYQDLALFEKKQLDLFAEKALSLSQFIELMRGALEKN